MRISGKLRFALGALVFALIVYHCFFSGLDRLGFVGPDEPRYASVAREMAHSGDWVTPRLNGAPWLEKPPLYYWSAATGFRLVSSPELAARAPSGIFALAAVLVLMLLARRFYGAATAIAVGMALPATVAMTGFARAAATDMPFAACLTLSMAAAACLLLEDSPASLPSLAAGFGAVLGLAVLAKGPAAIVLAGGSVAIWAATSRNIRRSFRLFHPAAVAAFAVVAAPWYALCAARNPQFIRIFFLEHNMERFLSNRYQHQQPFWFFAPILLIAVFPWTLLLIPAFAGGWRAFRAGGWRNSPGVFFACWVIFPLVFFSASQSKLPGYILPAVPPLLLLVCRAIPQNGNSHASPSRFRLLWVAAPLLAAGLFLIYNSPGGRLAAFNALRPVNGLEEPLASIGAVLLVAGLASGCAGWLRYPLLGAALAAFLFSFAVGIATHHVLPMLDSQISPRELARALSELPSGSAVAEDNPPRAWQYGAEFYLDRALPEWTPSMRRPVYVITSAPSGKKPQRREFIGQQAWARYGPVAIYRLE